MIELLTVLLDSLRLAFQHRVHFFCRTGSLRARHRGKRQSERKNKADGEHGVEENRCVAGKPGPLFPPYSIVPGTRRGTLGGAHPVTSKVCAVVPATDSILRMNTPTAYRVQAANLSHASENKIHDDEIARRFGFRGGLVPGVEVYAYMTHLPVTRWGVAWLERGRAECRCQKPVYDGRIATVSASEADSALSISVESEGELCATGSAALPDERGAAPAVPTPTPMPAAEDRPDADEATLAVGRRLSSQPLHLTADALRQYLAAIRETEPLYARDGLAHPALLLRLSNAALKDNVKLGPWIHVGSSIRHFGLAHAGQTLVAHASVAANYPRGGHKFVELDVTVVADSTRAVAQIRHTAIYRPKQAA